MNKTAELMKILLVEDSLPDVELTLEALAGARAGPSDGRRCPGRTTGIAQMEEMILQDDEHE